MIALKEQGMKTLPWKHYMILRVSCVAKIRKSNQHMLRSNWCYWSFILGYHSGNLKADCETRSAGAQTFFGCVSVCVCVVCVSECVACSSALNQSEHSYTSLFPLKLSLSSEIDLHTAAVSLQVFRECERGILISAGTYGAFCQCLSAFLSPRKPLQMLPQQEPISW